MSASIVTIENITKRFKGEQKPALNTISTQIHYGKMTGLVGPDGAGKTTLIRHIIGLLQADEGSITVKGFDSKTQAAKIHSITGYMPQKFGLYEDLSVIENLRLYADLRDVVGREREEKFAKLLRFTDLERFQTRLAGKLSGGMKQKLGLACALVGDPELLLLDEPSVGVDPISRRELWKMVQALLVEGMAVVWSTAYLDEAEKCDSVILLNQGEKLHDGPPAEVLKNVEGRTWQIRGIAADKRRAVLMHMLKQPQVIDGVIQGRNIRIVSAKGEELPRLSDISSLSTASENTAYESGAQENISAEKPQWHQVKPWFEDAFIDILGGGPDGRSKLAEQMATKPQDDKPVIDARGLTKCFGDFTAVADNTFEIKRGEIFGLLGPNGAGKSTTFKMMCGLLQATRGEAFVTGLDLKTASSAARSRIGYMAQKFSLYGNLNLQQNLRFFAGIYGLSGKEKQNQIGLMIDIFDFKKYLRMNAAELPLGFKQRLALACAVMHQPDVLFLDEPTSGVDPITRREFWMHINAMVEKGVTVMVTTHFMDEAEYCDRIGLIYRGENIATGTPDDLKDKASKIADIHAPSLEEAFIALVRDSDARREQSSGGAAA